jgi:protein involved in polysaccharide export with SLBB domain
MMRLFAILCVLLCAVTGWANSSQPDRKIAPGDRIRMSIPEEASLSKVYTITADGLMLVDFLGAVQVANLTLREAAERITTRLLNERILRKATVGMEFLNEPATAEKSVRVSGALKNKNPIAWVKGMRLADVIRIAGVENNADLSRITIIKADKSQAAIDFTKYNPANNGSNPELAAGDEVQVPVRSGTIITPPIPPVENPNQGGGITTPPITNPAGGFVYVVGGVNRPGPVPFKPNMTLAQAIADAGGFSARGDKAKVKVEKLDRSSLNFDLSAGGETNVLQPGDQVVIEIVGGRRFVQVNGSVGSPGLVEFTDGLTLSQAIARAGGLAGNTQPGDVVITSALDGRTRRVNFAEIIKGYRGDTVLAAGDMLNVGGRMGTGPAPQPRPTGGSSNRRTTDTLVVAGAAALFIWLIGR